MSAASAHQVGELLRDWRQRRRMSQLDLSNEAEVSARHLSFVETGRSKPSRALVLHLAGHLDVPLRERNALLLAAGYAPTFPATPLDAEPMSAVRKALDTVLTSHEPFPALIVDRRWDLVSANRPAQALLSNGVSPTLLDPPVNALRVSLHPDGLAPHILNLPQWRDHLLARLEREIGVSADPNLVDLLEELRTYPGGDTAVAPTAEPAEMLFVPLRLQLGENELSFISTIATFGTPMDVTMAELSIESFFPADANTEKVLRRSFE